MDKAQSVVALCLLLCCLFPARSFAVPPPIITVQPLDQNVANGGTATFTVVATSGTTLSYQWYKDGLLILDQLLPGQTASTLTLNNVGDSDVGHYFVEVMNAGGTVDSRKALLTVGPNTPPVANNDTYSTLEDVLLAVPVSGILINDSDLESGMTAILVGNVSNGSLILSTNGSFTYQPNTNFNGSDSFTYRAWDNGSPVPFIAQQNTTGGANYSLKGGAKGAQSFRHGTAGAPSYTITKVLLHLSRESSLPNANLNFNIGTGINAGAIAGSSVAITPTSITNTSSGSSFQDYELVFGTPVGPLTAGTTYYLNLDSAASKNFYVERAGSNTYAGGTYYKDGVDQAKDMWFQIYSITNSPSTNSGLATVTLNVTPVNDPPVAVNDSTNTLEDLSVTVRVLANDSDTESPLTITGTTTTNGTAVISGANVVFTPSPDFNGTAVFSYTISDGTDSDTANVTVNVISVNDASPVANDDTYSTLEDTALTIPVAGVLANDTDVDGDPMTALLLSNVSNGSLSLNTNGSFTYTPNTNYNGSDSFTYRVSDGLDPVVAILEQNNAGGNKIEVKKGKDGAQSFRHGTAGGASYTISTIVLYVSREPALPAANPAFSIGTGVNSGAMAGSSVTIPASSITNTTSGASFQTYEIAYPTPVGPFTAGTTYYLNLDNSTDKRFFVEYPNSNTYTNGTYYDDGSDQNEDMRFQVFGRLSDIATVTLTVTPVNDTPFAVNDSTNTLEDVSVTIQVLGNDSDVEGSPLTITGTTTTNGTAVISGANVVFTPSTNFNGTAVFSYTISDGVNSDSATVTVNVISVNDAPPVANDDTYNTLEDTALAVPVAGVLANDTDVDGDPKTALLLSNVGNGSLSFNTNGSFTYTPNTNYNGTDSFTYVATDGMATGNIATVTINVTPVNDRPFAVNDSTNTLEDVSVTIQVLGNDSDVEGSPLTITGTTTTNGTAVISGANVVFTPSTNFNGTAVFSYTISDGTISATANVTVTVAPVNDAPAARNDTYTTLEDLTLTVPAGGILTNDTDVEGTALTAVLVSNVSNGSLSLNANGSFTYTPNTNYNGSDSFTYRPTDGLLTGNVATVTINITPVNDTPFAVDDVTNTLEDVSVTVRVLVNDSDVEGTPLTITSTSTTNGTAVINGTNIVFRASTNFNGTAVFSYTITDGVNSDSANVTITVTPVNDAPVATNDTYTSPEDLTLTVASPGVLANDWDPDSPMTTLLVSNVTKGSLSLNANGGFTYTPNTNYNGSDSFTYRPTDGLLTGNVATVTINITPVNDTPFAVDDATNTLEDVSVTVRVLVNDSDVEGTPLTITSTSTTNGTAVISGTNVVFTPATNFNGTAVFSYTISDGVNSDSATVTVTVIPVNDTPFAVNDSVSTPEDVSVTIPVLVNDSDVEGTPLTITSTSTTNGTAVINGTNIVFRASTNFNGTAVFSYTISDGVNSDPATVTVTVTPVNDAPVAYNETYTTLEDVPLIVPAAGILSNDTDVDTNVLTAWLVSDVSNGTLNLNTNGSFTYTPDTNYNGTDSFTYRARDGVYPILQENTNGGSRIDVQLGKKGAQSFRHGTAGETNYTISKIVLYLSREATAPNANLTFTIGTGINSGTIAGSSVAIDPLSITNTSSGVSFQRYEIVYATPIGPLVAGTTYYLNLECEAGNGNNIYTEFAAGSSTYANGTYYYAGMNLGRDMKFAICDSTTSGTATVTINVTAVNDAPFANNDTPNTLEDVSVTIPVLANDSDVEGSPLTITGTSTTNGTAVISGTNVVFTPSTNFNGTAVFNYTISDGALSATGKVTVTVTPVNDAPFAVNDSTNTLEDVSVTIKVLANDSDVERSALTITSTSTTNGTAVISGTNIVFRASTNFNGVVVFSYTISDGALSDTANVTVNIAPVNDAPVAYNDTYGTLEDVPLIVSAAGILANDTDVEGNALSALLVSNVTKGSLSLNPNGGFTYTPNTNYNGSDSFTYRAKDGLLTGNVATVTINITPVNDPPFAIDDTTNTLEDVSVTVQVLANDSDVEGTPMSIIGVVTTNGTAVVSGTNIIFTPATNFNGTVVFRYINFDGNKAAIGDVTVTVAPVNDAPEANSDTYATLEDVPLTVPVAGLLSTGTPGAGILSNDTDVDGDAMTAVIVSDVTHGKLSLNSNGSFTYTPDADYNGPDSFTYRATDGIATGNVATVTINVTPVSDPLTFTSQQMTANGFELQMSGPDSSTYVISASTNLTDWTPIFTNYTALGNMTFTDTSVTDNPIRFYRAEAY